MGDVLHFGIIDEFEEGRDYSEIDFGMDYEEYLEEFEPVLPIYYDFAGPFMELASELFVYYCSSDNAGFGLDDTGVNILPPKSVGVFYDLVQEALDGNALEIPDDVDESDYDDALSIEEYAEKLLELLGEAIELNAHVICFGV